MKKVLSLILVLITALAVPFSACAAQGRELIYSNNNPLPEIYERVSPAVVELCCVTRKWDAVTDTVTVLDESYGSAVYVDERGYFLTNWHVVKEADELEIRLADGTAIEAYVVGGDEAVDVAVVKIDEAFDATPVTIGRSGDLRVGEVVCTIGTPVSESIYNTMTAGIVSGLNREDADMEATRAVGLIQIDAAINPGNSGGALLNTDGKLVGIPFMKYMGYVYEDADGQELMVYEGINFAVPIDTAWPIAQSLIETGKFSRPRFGVSVVSIEGPDEPLKNYPPAGLQVQEVEKNGSGARAGLRVNDVITHVNGTRIKDFREYTKIIDKLPAGESFVITVARYDDENGEKLRKPEIIELTVVLEMID